MKEINKNASAFIRRVREEKGMTLQQVADKAGVTYQQIQRFESCKGVMSLGKLVMFCEILEVDILDAVKEITEGVEIDINVDETLTKLVKEYEMLDANVKPTALNLLRNFRKSMENK